VRPETQLRLAMKPYRRPLAITLIVTGQREGMHRMAPIDTTLPNRLTGSSDDTVLTTAARL
jgi:hypothetical protein